MHCVYSAFAQHIQHLGEPNYARVYDVYKNRKIDSHGYFHQDAFAGVLPWLYWNMLFEHNIHANEPMEMRIERSYVTLPEYMPSASPMQRKIMFEHTQYWGNHVEKVVLEPAIYCLLNEQHAEFSTKVPSWPGARILFAVQIFPASERQKSIKSNKEQDNDRAK